MTDTAPIRPEEHFDEARVAAWLREELDLGDASVSFAQFPGGHANLTYLAVAGERELVLRRPPLGPVAPGSHDMAREYRVLAVLHAQYPPAPRAFAFCGDESVMGKPFFVMERRHGRVIRTGWPPGLDRRIVAENLIDALGALHLVDYRGLGLEDLGRPEGFSARQVAGWTDRWHRAKHADVAAMDELAAGLAAAIPDPQRAVLLHNDFKLDNAMLDDDGALVAIFDWDMATLGDPLVDLGSTLSYWGDVGGPSAAVFGDAAVLGGVMAPDEVAARYAEQTGIDLSSLGWYRALGMFRIAVILQQIYIRFRRGQTSDERFSRFGAAVPLLAEAGVELL